MASTGHPTTDRKGYEAIQALVKGIERDGGLKGYEKWIAAQGGAPAKPPKAPRAPPTASNTGKPSASDENSFFLTADWGSAIAYTWITCEVPSQSGSGSGGSWGPGLGLGDAAGPLLTDLDWNTFKTSTTSFTLAGGGEEVGGALLTFFDGNDNEIGTAALVGEVEGGTWAVNGNFSWD